MKVTSAMLCDAATVREGLLHILGGGVSALTRPEVPTNLDADLAVMIEMATSEVLNSHVFSVTGFLQQETGVERQVFQLNAELGPTVEAPQLSEGLVEAPTPVFNIPLVVPFRALIIGQEGLHRLALSVDGEEVSSLWFRVTLRPDLFQEMPVSDSSAEDS